MRVTGVEVWTQQMQLAEPYAVAYQAFERATNVFVRLTTDKSCVGFGCAAPEAEVTGETPQRTVAALTDVASAVVQGTDPLRWRRPLERLRAVLLPGTPAALAAVDIALLDLLGKILDRPLYQLLGGFRERIRTSVTIGILDEQQTVERARHRIAQGFSCLKLKGGLDVDQDIARVMRVSEAVGPEIELRFDANQGYSLQQCRRFIKGVRQARVTVLEQPTPRAEAALLGRARHELSVPVMADESLLGLGDAFRLLRRGLVDMVNVKLMKVGGIVEATQIASVARAARVAVMVGCMDESALGIAAGLQFCLAHPAVRLADLDGHLDLVDDPFAGSVTLRNGMLYPRPLPGVGAVPC